MYRERSSKREVQLLKALVFLQTTLWRYLLGRDAQDLEQSNAVAPLCLYQCVLSVPHCCVLILISLPPQADDEYMLSDYDLFVNQFISVPKDMGQLNCAAFIAGILKGALHGAGFPARHLTSLAQSFAA